MFRSPFFSEMRRLQKDFDRLFSRLLASDSFFRDFSDEALLPYSGSKDIVSRNIKQPLADVFETDNEIIATVELPGVKKEDIELNATDNGIELKVEKKEEHKEQDNKKGYYRLERNYSGFYRFFSMPEYADLANINASYKNGVLEIKVPKKESHDSKKRIEIKE